MPYDGLDSSPEPATARPSLRASVREAIAALVRKAISGPVVFSVFCLLLALVAVRGEWLTFPLRASLSAVDISLSLEAPRRLIEIPVAKLFRLLVLAGVLAAIFSRFSAVVLYSAALVVLGLVPVCAAFGRVSWLEGYVRESSERLVLGAYANEHFVSNSSPEPAFTPALEFETAGQQLAVGFSMLGWGWYIAFGSLVVLTLMLYRGWRERMSGWVGALSFASFGVLGLGPPLAALLSAQADQDSGDGYLLSGNGAGAIDAYSRAIEKNPALGASRPFLQKASMAFNVASGGRHVLGVLAQDLDLAGRRDSGNVLDLYAQARSRLFEVMNADSFVATALERPLVAEAERLRAELWLAEGLQLAEERRFPEALGAYLRFTPRPDSMSSFYLAHAYIALGIGEPAIPLLTELELRVGHPSVRADIHCTLGDAHTATGNIVEARDEYRRCRELDKIDNARALKALTGS
jgi:hypothetical protein